MFFNLKWPWWKIDEKIVFKMWYVLIQLQYTVLGLFLLMLDY